MVKKLFVCTLLTMLAAACARPIIHINYKPAPEVITYGTVPELGIQISYSIINKYYEKEGQELAEKSEYLNSMAQEPILINKKQPVTLTAIIRIINPDKSPYQLYYNRSFEYTNIKHYIEERVYSGRLTSKEFIFDLPTASDTIGQLNFEIRSKEDEILFETPTTNYEIRSKRRRK